MSPNTKSNNVQNNAGDAAHKTGEAGTGMIDKGREMVDGAVKKTQDALPNSHEEAGRKAGHSMDQGVQHTKNTVNDHTPNDKNDGGGIINSAQEKIHEWTKGSDQKHV